MQGWLSLLALLLLAVFPSPSEAGNSSCANFCPTLAFQCIGSDSGGCCGEFIPESADGMPAFCAYSTYCMVQSYTCCGCHVINRAAGIYECGGCPSNSHCVNLNGTTERTPGTRWNCNSGSGLLPNLLVSLLLAGLACLLLQLGKY